MKLNEAIKRNPYDSKRGNKSAYCRYLRYNVDGWYQLDSKEVLRRWQKVSNMDDNIFENLTEEEQKLAWMYMIFNKDKIIEKTEQWTKEAEKDGMTLTEYLESINPLNDKESEDTE